VKPYGSRVDIHHVAWQSDEPWNTLGHAAGAFLTSSGFGGLTALIAAYIAWKAIKANVSNVDKQLDDARKNLEDQAKRDGDNAAEADRLEAIVGAIEALAEAKHNVRQRDINYNEFDARKHSDALKAAWAQTTPPIPSSGDTGVLDRARDAAASRHWKLPAAGARLQLAGVDRTGFNTVHELINVYSGLSYKREDKDKIRVAELAAEEGLKQLTAWFVQKYGAAATANTVVGGSVPSQDQCLIDLPVTSEATPGGDSGSPDA
jgi:hypothetical protein